MFGFNHSLNKSDGKSLSVVLGVILCFLERMKTLNIQTCSRKQRLNSIIIILILMSFEANGTCVNELSMCAVEVLSPPIT